MWLEPRLYIPETFTDHLNVTDTNTMVPVNLELVNHLWLPNVFIYNLKTFKVCQALTKSEMLDSVTTWLCRCNPLPTINRGKHGQWWNVITCYCITATVRFVKLYFAQLWGLTLHCLKKQSFHLCFGLHFRPDLAEAGGTHWCWLLLWHKCVWLSNIVLPFNNVSESLFRSDLWGEISQTNRQLSADNKLLDIFKTFLFFSRSLK